jgi:hypothetical protein
MSLTTDFLDNYANFMANQAILIPAQVPKKNQKLDFLPQGAHAAYLKKTDKSVYIPGYYVQPVANNINEYALPTQQPGTYYMFTDAMNGCQFLAYGPDRQHVTVEHNNFIDDNDRYVERLQYITDQNYPYFYHISAGLNNIPNGTYNFMQGVNIVGEYTVANGWYFSVRDRVDLENGTVYGPF